MKRLDSSVKRLENARNGLIEKVIVLFYTVIVPFELVIESFYTVIVPFEKVIVHFYTVIVPFELDIEPF